MNEFEEDFLKEDNKHVIPNAAIYKKEDGLYGVVRFSIEDDAITGDTNLTISSATIQSDTINDIDHVKHLDLDSVLFTYISYEFDLDEENGLMEMQLCSEVSLAYEDGEEKENVIAENIINENPEDLIPVYLNVIKSM